MNQVYDYIIVGAGSAGCVLANRLSEDPSVSVLLLEYGGSDRSVFIQMPTALSIPLNSNQYAWQFHTLPEPYIDNRVMHCPRGKVLGGSSSINGMVYVRGHAMDFEQWRELGAEGWDYAHCLPYFKKADDWKYDADDYRSQGGPLSVGNGNEMQNPLYQAFVDAGVEAGYLATADYNGAQQEGFGAMHMTVKNGVRWSSSNAYLRPAMRRKNLTVISKALCRRVLLRDRQAVGIEFSKGGKSRQVNCNRELILAAGSIGSPQLLQLSGIGPADVLKQAGIELVHHLPGVGRNLQDHLELYIQFQCKQPITLNGRLDWWHKFLIGTRWMLFKSGLGATNHFESCAFIRSKSGLQVPDLQYHFLPAAIRYDGQAAFSGHGFQVHVGPNKPLSRGTVKVTSSDPCAKPEIRFNYLQHQDDIAGFRQCVRLTREIIAQAAMDPYRGAEIQPGEAVRTDAEIDSFVRQAVESAYHPSCSCKMGVDAMAVVDPQTRVHGIDKLRVVDASIFPTITNGNLNSPTIMVAEKAADLIKGKAPLPAVDAAVRMAPHWQTKQR